jgi:hypothetical protein
LRRSNRVKPTRSHTIVAFITTSRNIGNDMPWAISTPEDKTKHNPIGNESVAVERAAKSAHRSGADSFSGPSLMENLRRLF